MIPPLVSVNNLYFSFVYVMGVWYGYIRKQLFLSNEYGVGVCGEKMKTKWRVLAQVKQVGRMDYLSEMDPPGLMWTERY